MNWPRVELPNDVYFKTTADNAQAVQWQNVGYVLIYVNTTGSDLMLMF